MAEIENEVQALKDEKQAAEDLSDEILFAKMNELINDQERGFSILISNQYLLSLFCKVF